MVGERADMNNEDKPSFLSRFTGMCEYWEKKYSDALLDIYWCALSDLTIDQFEQASSQAVQRLTFFPKVAELRELISGNGEAEALSAWQELQKGISRAGAYQSVLFEDPRITRLIEIMGGWVEVCAWPLNELKFRRKEFLDAYKVLPATGEPKVLAGICERDNCARGYIGHAPKPILISSDRLQINTGEQTAIPSNRNSGHALPLETQLPLDIN
jgi:hypothetical protein